MKSNVLRRKSGLLLIALASTALAGCSQTPRPAAAGSPKQPMQAERSRVDELLAKMTLEEKAQLIHGSSEPAETYQGQAGWIAGVPRLGVPGLRLADGPHGVLTREISAAPPSTLALAATFDVTDATAVGQVIGHNARARGIDIVLEPYINIYRDPTFARAANTYGEDPLLVGTIGSGLIKGIQEQGVMAMAKHAIAYEGGNVVQVGPQALNEIYLAPFDDAIAAGVSSIMCSYNKVNGGYACGSGTMQNGLLRDRLGFNGFVTSDWGATHGAEYIKEGLDLEMPGDISGPIAALIKPTYILRDPDPTPVGPPPPLPIPGGMGSEIPEETVAGREPPPFPRMEGVERGRSPTLSVAMRAGTVTAADIDRAAGRVLGQIVRFGYLDGRQKHEVTDEPIAQNAPVLEKASRDAAVLLKNEGALPLSVTDLSRTALIGPGAAQLFAVVETGERALGWPDRQISPAEAIRQSTGSSPILAVADDMTGIPIPAANLILLRSTEASMGRGGALDYTVAGGNPLQAGSKATWNGSLEVPETGDYDLNLQLLGAAGTIEVDGRMVGGTGSLALHGDVLQAGQDNVVPTPDGLDNVRRLVRLTKGRHPFKVSVEADPSGKPVQVRLAWVTPQKKAADRAEAVRAARTANKVVIFAWSRGKPDGFSLPGGQNELIDAVATANPNTVVVLNTGGAVAMPWLSKVNAVLQMWYTGDEGGPATADLLLGRASPGGRLPFTWPKRQQDLVASDPAHPERSLAGANGVTTYSEGILVGYRWFDAQKIEPLYPFGYGLSYSRFDYSDLNVSHASDGGLDVSFTLRNAGTIAADEVPQVYLGRPRGDIPGVQFAERALASFERVSLAPGETRRITLHVTPRRLEYWSEQGKEWRKAGSARAVSVGASSRDLRLTGASE